MIRILYLLFLGVIFTACNTQPANTIRISGHVPADIANALYLTKGEITDSIPVSAGNFDQNFSIIEPGFYIRPAEDIDPGYWNIGIRIEDDALVTKHGPRLLTRGVPVDADAIEALMNH